MSHDQFQHSNWSASGFEGIQGQKDYILLGHYLFLDEAAMAYCSPVNAYINV